MRNSDQPFDVIARDDTMEALLNRYIGRRLAQSIQLQTALNEQNYDFIEAIGHNLLGTGAAYGMPRLTDIGARLEEAAIQRNLQVLRLLASEYDSFVHNVRIIRHA